MDTDEIRGRNYQALYLKDYPAKMTKVLKCLPTYFIEKRNCFNQKDTEEKKVMFEQNFLPILSL